MPWTHAQRSPEATTSRKVEIVVLAATFALALPKAPLPAADPTPPLSQRIDRAIADAHLGPQAPLADDAEFARRVYLDLVGRIPSTAELQALLSDASADRRAQLIDRLLKSDECNQHLAVVFDVMLMERRPDKYVPTDQWRRYLAESFAANKPLNQLIAEILGSSGEEGEGRAAAKFLLDREVEGNAIARDVSRMFLGRDIQCAQCHDHPLISDYSQAEYYGVLSYLNRSFLFEKTNENNEKVSLIGERAEGDVSYASVFEPGAEKVTALASLPSGVAYDQEPLPAPDEAYLVAPDKNVRPVPRYSRRARLAQVAADDRSDLLRKNMANRLWRILMKQGLVEPPDLIHSDNPASYPLLLDELADALGAMHYDTKEFLRQIALSQAYQRSITIPEQLLAAVEDAAERDPQWQQQLAFQQQVTERAKAEWQQATQRLATARAAIVRTRADMTAARQQRDQAAGQKNEAQKQRDQAHQRREQQAQLVEALQVAAEKSQSASQQRKDDAELAAASQLLAQRVQTAQQELAKTDEEIAGREAAIQQADAAIAAADKTLEGLRATHDEQAARAKEEGGAFGALKHHFEVEQDRVVQLRHQIELAEQMLALRDAEQTFATLAQRRQTQASQHEAAVAARRELERRQADQQADLAGAAQRQTGAVKALDAATKQSRDHQQLLESLRAAADQVAAARDQLQGDAELAAAYEQLVQRTEQLQQPQAALEQQRDQAAQAVEQAKQQQHAAAAQLEATAAELARSQQQTAQTEQASQAAQAELDAAEAQTALLRRRLRDSLTRRFVVSSIQALSPEQLASSVICALNLEPRFRAEAEGEWQSKNKDKPAAEIDAQQRQQELAELIDQRRKGVESTFVSLFSGTPGSPQDVFFATVDQALFLDNDGRIQSWLNPQQENLAARLNALESPEAVADDLYRSVLSRAPHDDERTAVADYLNSNPDHRTTAIQDLIWSLLTSVEFRFNH